MKVKYPHTGTVHRTLNYSERRVRDRGVAKESKTLMLEMCTKDYLWRTFPAIGIINLIVKLKLIIARSRYIHAYKRI